MTKLDVLLPSGPVNTDSLPLNITNTTNQEITKDNTRPLLELRSGSILLILMIDGCTVIGGRVLLGGLLIIGGGVGVIGVQMLLMAERGEGGEGRKGRGESEGKSGVGVGSVRSGSVRRRVGNGNRSEFGVGTLVVGVGIVDGGIRVGLSGGGVGVGRVRFVEGGEVAAVGNARIVELSGSSELMRRVLFVAVRRVRGMSRSALGRERVDQSHFAIIFGRQIGWRRS